MASRSRPSGRTVFLAATSAITSDSLLVVLEVLVVCAAVQTGQRALLDSPSPDPEASRPTASSKSKRKLDAQSMV